MKNKPDKKVLEGAVYQNAPIIVYWESTKACDLDCRHCRAEAIRDRNPAELTTDQVKEMFRRVRSFGSTMVVITGGDPMKRPDIFELIDYARSIGLPISITPSGTNNIRKIDIARLKGLGVQCVALSIDGSGPVSHDNFRRVDGCFGYTMQVAQWVRDFNIPLQINTTVCGETYDDVEQIFEIVKALDAVRWSVFFLVPVGRGAVLRQISPQQCERLLIKLFSLSKESGIPIKTTEGHHFRRVAMQKMQKMQKFTSSGMPSKEVANILKRFGSGIRDGNGIMFVSDSGDIFPSGFLPLRAGNVHKDDIVTVYRESPVFKALRDPDRFEGKCGRCKYRGVCGGSRARAFATTGNYLESDELCLYNPLF